MCLSPALTSEELSCTDGTKSRTVPSSSPNHSFYRFPFRTQTPTTPHWSRVFGIPAHRPNLSNLYLPSFSEALVIESFSPNCSVLSYSHHSPLLVQAHSQFTQVYPKIQILLSFSHRYVVSNTYDFVFLP